MEFYIIQNYQASSFFKLKIGKPPTDYDLIAKAMQDGLPADALQESPNIVRRNILPSTKSQYDRMMKWFDALVLNI